MQQARKQLSSLCRELQQTAPQARLACVRRALQLQDCCAGLQFIQASQQAWDQGAACRYGIWLGSNLAGMASLEGIRQSEGQAQVSIVFTCADRLQHSINTPSKHTQRPTGLQVAAMGACTISTVFCMHMAQLPYTLVLVQGTAMPQPFLCRWATG